MIATENKQFRLAARPSGMPKASDWDFTTNAVERPGAGQVLVKVVYLSLDPAMRGWMNEGRSYIPPVGIGEVMRALAMGRVAVSADPSFSEGDLVSGMLNVQEYATVPGKELQKIDADGIALTANLNALGMPGMTAYFGLLDVGEPKSGETVVVSGAAGAVGMTVGQIAKIKGCRVVGIAGGPQKCAYVKDVLGFDATIDYKAEDLNKALRKNCEKGIDVYFDNVGGDTLDACLARLARNARVVICGAISQYNTTEAIKGPSNYLSLLVNRARMQGMVVLDYADRNAEAQREIAGWIREGKLVSLEDVVEGLDKFPQTLLKLFKGENFGKLVLQVAAP